MTARKRAPGRRSVELVWEWPERGDPTFRVEAPTAEEVDWWDRAVSRSGLHKQVNAMRTPGQQPIKDQNE